MTRFDKAYFKKISVLLEEILEHESNKMEETAKIVEETPSVDADKIRQEALAERAKEVKEMQALGVRHNLRDFADECINKGTGLFDFREIFFSFDRPFFDCFFSNSASTLGPASFITSSAASSSAAILSSSPRLDGSLGVSGTIKLP